MCGITGIVSSTLSEFDIHQRVSRSVKLLKSRGPDNEGQFSSADVALGHSRLSIIDVSAKSNQPLQDASGRYFIIFNGEFYNYQEHYQNLSSDGVKFNTSSDTEVLLNLYIKYGEDCLEYINGFFAFAIYDTIEKKIFLARDRFGIKPLLYCKAEGIFAFASEHKAIYELGIEKKIDRISLVNYLQLNYIPGPHSMIEGVRKLTPGSFIQFSVNDNYSEIQEQNYFKINSFSHSHQVVGYETAKDNLKELMLNSIKYRMIADVPLGAFLSGGIDSSIVVALASQFTNQLKTFSIGYKDSPVHDETKYASMVAEMYKTDHTVFNLSNDDLFESLFTTLNYIDEPFADSSALAVNILSAYTSKHVKVALSGDGADELFGGYNKHRAEWIFRNRKLFSTSVSLLSTLLLPFNGSRNSKYGNKIRQAHRFSEAAKMEPVERYWRLCSFIDEEAVDDLLDVSYDEHDYFRRKRSKLKPLGNASDINDLLMMDMNMVLQDDMLVKVDMMSMCHSLEVRVPFLDHELVNFAFSLPVEYKIDRHQQKKILRDTFRSMLPAALFSRPKHGFEVPLLTWMQNDLKLLIQNDLLADDFIEDQGIFNLNGIRRIKKRLFSNNPGEAASIIWGLVVFQYWWKKYMSNNG